MMFFSIIFIFISFFLLFKNKRFFRFSYITLFVLFISLLLIITYAVSDYFTDNGIDESVIYHLRYGLGEAGFAEYARLIIVSTVAFIFITLLLYYAIKVLNVKRKNSYVTTKLYDVPLFFSIVAVVVNPASENIYNLIKAEFSSQIVDNADYIKVEEINTKKPLNLIYIYAESLEETYFDERLFPGLMPNLSKLRNRAIVFKDVSQVTHSGWTIAGMVASQCGVPLFSASHGNAMSGMPQFLSGATCLGDVLNRNKYELSYLGGASLDFAGKGNFYKTHGFTSVQGRAELSQKLEDPSYQSAWGLYDDSLFAIAKHTLADRTAKKAPFALFMLTLDTHHPKGHLSASCVNYNYIEGDNEILNAVHCSDKLIGEFIEDIHSNGFDKNTLIVIGSDHLAMKNTATDLLNQGNRKNMLIMLPPELPEGMLVNTPSSILDVSATILPLLGFESEELGFGRNILNDSKLKMIGQYKDFNSYLNSSNDFVASFWSYPEAVNDIYFKSKKNRVYFAKKNVKYPVLFLINEDNVTDKVIFEFDSEKKLSEYLKEQSSGQRILWIDQCSKVNAVFGSSRKSNSSENCLAIGSLGSDEVLIEAVNTNIKISKSKVHNQLRDSNKAITQIGYKRQMKILNRLVRNGVNADEYAVLPKSSGYESIFIKSVAGIEDGQSLIRYSSNSTEHVLAEFERGLNLIGFSRGKPVEIIYKIDTCNGSGKLDADEKIADVINNQNYDFYLLIAHDSAVCETTERLQSFLKDSSLRLWSELSWRQAYAAIIYQDGSSLELLGENGQTVNVILK